MKKGRRGAGRRGKGGKLNRAADWLRLALHNGQVKFVFNGALFLLDATQLIDASTASGKSSHIHSPS